MMSAILFCCLLPLWFWVYRQMVPLGVVLMRYGRGVWSARRRYKKRLDQWPEALLLMSSALRAGLTLEQSLRVLITQSPHPLRSYLSHQWQQADASRPLAAQLDVIFNEPGHQFLRQSCAMAYKTGAPYALILATTAKQWRQKRLFQQKVLALTAQSRMSAKVIAVAPVLFLAALSLISPDFVRPLFTTETGLLLLFVVALMNMAGFFTIRAMVKRLC